MAVLVDALLHRRWTLVRDVLLAALLVVGASFVLAGVVESDWLPVEPHLLSNWGYPELRLATATAILVVAGPELVRWARLVVPLWEHRAKATGGWGPQRAHSERGCNAAHGLLDDASGVTRQS